MTNLDSSPFIVSMIQVAISLPICLLAIPAGALSDIVDRRKFLIFGELSIMAASVVFALLVSRHLITPASLLIRTFVVSAASTATAPPWQAVVNRLVPKSDLPPAIALSGAGINVSRAIGPALGGILISTVGIAAPSGSMRSVMPVSSPDFSHGTRSRKSARVCRPNTSSTPYVRGYAMPVITHI